MPARHRRELDAFAPDERGLEFFQQLSMDLRDAILDGDAATTRRQNDWVLEVGCRSLLLGVDADHAQLLPDLLEQNVEAEFHVNRNAATEWVLRNCVNFLD